MNNLIEQHLTKLINNLEITVPSFQLLVVCLPQIVNMALSSTNT
jgi:hypothetical protein